MPTHIHTNRCRATLLRVIGDSPAIAQVLNRTHNGSHDCPLCDTVGYKDPTTRSMVFPALIGNPRTTKDAITKGREMDTELASLTPEAMLHMAQQKNPTRPSSCGYLGSCPLTDVPGFEVHRDVNVDMRHAEKKLMDIQISPAKGTGRQSHPKPRYAGNAQDNRLQRPKRTLRQDNKNPRRNLMLDQERENGEQ